MLKQIASIAAAALTLSTSLPAMAEDAVKAIQFNESAATVAETMEQAEIVFSENAPAAFAPMGNLFDGGLSMHFDWGRHDGINGFAYGGLSAAKAYDVIFSHLSGTVELSCSNEEPPYMASVRGEVLTVDQSACQASDERGYIGDLVIIVNTSVSTGKVVTAAVNWTM